MDDEFYKERARHIRELADEADPFIRKRLLDLASNYDSIVRRSTRRTPTMPSKLPSVPAGNSPASDAIQSRPAAYLGDGRILSFGKVSSASEGHSVRPATG